MSPVCPQFAGVGDHQVKGYRDGQGKRTPHASVIGACLVLRDPSGPDSTGMDAGPVGFGPALASATIPSGKDDKLLASAKTGYCTGPLFLLPHTVPAVPSLVALVTMVLAQEMRGVLSNQGLFKAGRTECTECLRKDCPVFKGRTHVCCMAQAKRECPTCGEKGHDKGCMKCGGKGGAGLACCAHIECCKSLPKSK